MLKFARRRNLKRSLSKSHESLPRASAKRETSQLKEAKSLTSLNSDTAHQVGSRYSPNQSVVTGGLSVQKDEASKSYDSLLELNTSAGAAAVTTRRPRSLYVTRSYDCILDTVDEHTSTGTTGLEAFDRSYLTGENLTDDQMAAIRRTESDRRVGAAGLRPYSLHGSYQSPIANHPEPVKATVAHVLTHSRSTDNLTVLNRYSTYDEDADQRLKQSRQQQQPVKLSLYREPPLSNNSRLNNLGPAPQRSMSHRELSTAARMSSSSDGIVDAFGFAASGFHSTMNLYQHRSTQQQEDYGRRAPEIPPPPANYQPAPPTRHDSRGYRVAHQYSSQTVNHQPSVQNKHGVVGSSYSHMTSSQGYLHKDRHMNKENFEQTPPAAVTSSTRQNNWTNSQQHSVNGHPHPYSSQHHYNTRKEHSQPPVTNMASVGPVIGRTESVKKRMQKARNPEQMGGGAAGEVVSEKGRSVKSIIGLFDQPLNEFVASQKSSNPTSYVQEVRNAATGSERLQQAKVMNNAEVQVNGLTPQKDKSFSNEGRVGRNGTQVVHIAKFIQIETPNKSSSYTDAQTSPIMLSPVDRESAFAGAHIAKAETYNKHAEPKLATMTSSSSSYISNEVFTPTENIDAPVFDGADVPYQQSSYDSGAHTQYSDGTTTTASYDIAHNSHIPNHQTNSQPYYNTNSSLNETLRYDQGEEESSHYEDLDSLRAHSVTENIYEPISPMQKENNYMNFSRLSPSNEFSEMPLRSQESQWSERAEPEAMMRSISYTSEGSQSSRPTFNLNLDTSNQSADGNQDLDSQSYSDQVRQASHKTLRQTSVDSAKFKSPTREESLNRYNLQLSKVNINGVHQSNTPPSQGNTSPANQYSADGTAQDQQVTVKMRNKTHRTDSCRQASNKSRTHIDRTHSYRESRGSVSDIRGGTSDTKAMIRDNLRDFYIRKSRESTSSLDTMSSDQSRTAYNSVTSPGSAQAVNAVSPLNRQMHRIQSERTFSMKSSGSHPASQRAGSLDRTNHHHRHSLEIPLNAGSSGYGGQDSGPYMQTWEASNIANRQSMSSSERSPTSPLVTASTTEPPRVKQPLIADGSPFNIPPGRNLKDRNNKNENPTQSSSAGTTGPKPMKGRQSVPSTSSTGSDGAPTLPPRNYKIDPEEITHLPSTNTSFDRAASDVSDLNKPYQNVFNGSAQRHGSDDSFDADYTEKLRKLSENQKYVKSSSTSHMPSGKQPTAGPRTLNQAQPPQNHSLPNPLGYKVLPPGQYHSASNLPTPISPPSTGMQFTPPPPVHPKTHTASASPVSAAQASNRHVLETDIDDSTTENQPIPPPRPRSAKTEDHQNLPPKLPKKFPAKVHDNEINHNEIHSTSTASHISRPTHREELTPEPMVNIPEPTELHKKHDHHNKMEQYKNSRLAHHSVQQSDDMHQQEIDNSHSSPVIRTGKERRSLSVSGPIKHSPSEDLTVTSGDPSTHIARRQSIGKKSRSHSRRSSHSHDSSSETPKPSPGSRVHQRETEFSNTEMGSSSTPIMSHDNVEKPVPFNRYNHSQRNTEHNHSRQASAEILDITNQLADTPKLDKASTNSPVAAVRHMEHRPSPTPPPRSSPLAGRSSIASPASLGDSRKSTPSPHSSHSDLKAGKLSPSTPVDKTFVPISTEILADLSNQGIDINEKHNKCISDESKARLVKLTALNSSPPPTKSKKHPPFRHIRQKSSDEILCDHQVENLGKTIKDETLSQMLAQPQKGTTDYLPGIFDEILAKDVPRKQRVSMDSSSPCHSKQSSEGDGLLSKSTHGDVSPSELCTVEEQRDELIGVLNKKLSVLKQDQEFIQQEIEDNDETGEKIDKMVEQKCSDKETSKYTSYMADVEKITKLLLKLSRRLARAENELRNAPMDATDDDKKSLEQKRNNLQQQHDDAKALKESIDKRKATVISFLEQNLSPAEFNQYDNYVSIKLKLIMESNDLDDQIAHCEEQLKAVQAASS